jgi:RHS repeat-associated protein
VTYQSNADGYLAQRGADTFTFSTTGELLQATAGGQTVSFAYDGLRRRTGRTDAGGTTQYLYGSPDDALLLTQSRNPAGVLTTYFYDEGRRLFALQRGANRFYVGSDQVGSPRVVTDSAGAVVKVVEYDGYGVPTLDSNPAFELPIGFAGGVSDATTGFVRFGLRDYDPVEGRWTARDPATFGGGQANLYAYVNNDPVTRIDPSGFGSAGLGVCEGVCVGFKFAFTDKGISACVEAGFGVGDSVDIDPMGGLDKNEASLEAKVALKAGIGKFEYGLEVNDDPCGKPQGKAKGEVCVGPACANTGNEGKLSGDIDHDFKLKNPLKDGGLGAEGKVVGKVCQQALW